MGYSSHLSVWRVLWAHLKRSAILTNGAYRPPPALQPTSPRIRLCRPESTQVVSTNGLSDGKVPQAEVEPGSLVLHSLGTRPRRRHVPEHLNR
jgi:hypothetical protein